MDLKKAHQYAEVVIKKACNFQPGQTLYLEAQVEVEDFICIMAEEAYKAGASEVGVQWISNKLDRVHMQNGQVKPLAGPHLAEVEYFAKKNAVRIRVESPDLTVFDDVDADMIQKKAFVHRQARIRYEELADEVFGCIICVPSPSWAKAVYPEMPEEEALETLWETVFTCVRVNTPDPMKAWDEFIANTRKRIEILNTKNYRQYHYFSPVTDLYMSTIQPQVWGGACEDLKTVEGYNIINVPTEEVFACPHKYKVNGYITSTLPLVYDGKLIEDIRLTLKDGRIVEYTASKGADVLAKIIETDEGTHYFGEMALVDVDSPLSSMNTVFYTTLYDENASCHIAIGAGLADIKDPEEREKAGVNNSFIHVDFMVGSRELNIQGQREDGSWEDVFVNGSWGPLFRL